ncbi:hypothetical protein JXA34_03510 [Patescibacteria group bacterium]|nr:hypothetical protein [Patescibacteria group bacterium]
MNKNISFIYLDLGGVIATLDGVKTDLAELSNIPLDMVIQHLRKYDHKAVIAEISTEEIWK